MALTAQNPIFNANLISATCDIGTQTPALDGTATVTDGGAITYQWQSSPNGTSWTNIVNATGATYAPPIATAGTTYYRVIATNTLSYPNGLTPSETIYPSETLYPIDEGTSATATSTSNTATITVYAAQAPVFSADLVNAQYNIGSTATALDGTATAPHGDISYQWYKNGNIISGATAATYTPIITEAGSNTYYVVATNTVGTSSESATSNTATIAVYASEAPLFTYSLVDAEYDMGDATTALNGTATVPRGELTYQWYKNGSPISGAQSATYTPSSEEEGTSTYYVVATNTVGSSTTSSTSNTATITVYGATTPVFTAQLVSANYNSGDTATALNGTATAQRGDISYQWYSSTDGTSFSPISGQTNATYLPPTGTGGTIYYRVTATNTVGTDTASATSNIATITIYVAEEPVFNAALTGAEYDMGDSSTALNGTASAPHGTITYQWYLNGEAIAGAQSATYIPPTTAAGEFNYYVTATNIVGNTSATSTSNTVSTVVYGATTPTFAANLASAEYDIGTTATALNGTATAPRGTITYLWESSSNGANWQQISSATGATYTPPINTAGIVYYRVTATNTVGTDTASATSNSSTITVYEATAPEFNQTLANAQYNSGDNAAALNGTATAPRGTISYQWYSSPTTSNFTPISSATAATYTPPTTTGGTVYYQVVATNTVGTSTESSTSNAAEITVYVAEAPAFNAPLVSAEYDIGDTVTTLDGTATAPHGTISYQWYQNGVAIANATGPTYTPSSAEAGSDSFYVIATNIVGNTSESSTSNTVTITVYTASTPVFTLQPESADYIENGVAESLTVTATAPRGTISYQWQQAIPGNDFTDIVGQTASSYTPSTLEAGTMEYRCAATNTVGTASLTAYSDAASITVTAAKTPVFVSPLVSDIYNYSDVSIPLDGTATVTDGGTITYQWQVSYDSPNDWETISGATSPTYRPPTVTVGTQYYRVIATNTLQTSVRSATSNVATIVINDTKLSKQEQFQAYLAALKTPFHKLCRLRFLNPDGSTAFALDNNPYNPNSAAFIASGEITCNLQNGQRRQADVTLSNLTGKFDYSINNIWFGQQIALDEGLILPDGTEFYLPQGVFYISNPQESFMPNAKTVTLPLVDKWAYLDGTLFGNLEGIYEVPVNSNIFTAMSSVLAFDRGNGIPVDNVPPVFTNYFNNMSTALPDGSSISMLLSPYTLRVDADNGTYADILTGLATMLAAWIGYDQTGTLRVEPSQDDILDINKPILYAFTPNEAQLLGATYTVKNTDVYNDVIIMGEALNNEPQVAGRATNMDPRSDTNIYTSLGRRTKREAAAGYYTTQQCTDLAVWKLKRMSVLQKSVTISCQQMFHIVENNLVTICRTDKPGAPVERHLITGFSRPLTQTGSMTINCTSVNDFPTATVTPWPE